MKRTSIISWSALAFAATTAMAVGQAPPAGKPADQEKPAAEQKAPAGEKAIVVFFGNETCPNDGKKVVRDKFIEVDTQRIYVCSDDCMAALKKDAAAAKAALAKAYPSPKPVSAKTCSCGEAVDPAQAKEVTWQGYKLGLCSADCVTEFKKSPVVAIVTIQHSEVKDAKNAADPFDAKPVDPTIVGIYKGHLIHFSTWDSAAKFEKDPNAALTKLKLSS